MEKKEGERGKDENRNIKNKAPHKNERRIQKPHTFKTEGGRSHYFGSQNFSPSSKAEMRKRNVEMEAASRHCRGGPEERGPNKKNYMET